MQIGIIGGGTETHLSEKAKKIAFEVGYDLAKNGIIVITGGCNGIMKYACEGAKKGGGITVGILPFYDEKLANKFVDIKIKTGMSYGIRNNIIVHSADVLIGIAGGSGTLSEIALGDMYKKSVILIKGTGGWSDKLKYFNLDEKKKTKIIFVKSAKEGVSKAIKILKS